jgi:biopolymer transport protein TolR
MAMDVGGKKGGPMSDINITPLIDVLLVLLIIFMVIVPRTPHGLSTLIPQPNKKKQQQQDVLNRLVVVTVNAQQQIAINQTPVTVDNLQDRLTDIFKTRAPDERIMFVQGDPNVPFAAVAKVIDLGHGADLNKIGLIPKALAAQ